VKYDASCNPASDQPDTYFREKEVSGYDFNRFQVKTYWDGLRIEDYNRVFPLRIPISGGFIYDRKNKETVLEIRMVVKNFIKKYEVETANSAGGYDHVHFFGFSDWLRDVQAGDYNMGGNLHGVARAYVPGSTGSIGGTAAAGYVIVVPETDNVIGDYTHDTSPNPRDHNCNFPIYPSLSANTIDGRLDYYLKLEVFKEGWNVVLGTCADQTTYETAWETYYDAVSGFKIPMAAVYTDGSGYEITNVPPGSYNVYWAAVPAYGALFVDGTDFTGPGTLTPVTAGSAATVIIP
jgi:hypothetical protein